MTRDTGHVTHDILGFMIFRRFGGTESLAELISYRGDCRTAFATPGLFIIQVVKLDQFQQGVSWGTLPAIIKPQY